MTATGIAPPLCKLLKTLEIFYKKYLFLSSFSFACGSRDKLQVDYEYAADHNVPFLPEMQQLAVQLFPPETLSLWSPLHQQTRMQLLSRRTRGIDRHRQWPLRIIGPGRQRPGKGQNEVVRILDSVLTQNPSLFLVPIYTHIYP